MSQSIFEGITHEGYHPPFFSHYWLMVEVQFFDEWYIHLIWTKWERTCWCHQFLAWIIKNWWDLPKFLVFGFSEFLTVLSLFIAYFLIYILKSPKTSRPIRVKMFRLFNQQDNGAISKISKKLQQVTLQIYLMRTKSSQ